MRRPLEGYRVLDLTNVLAGPFCGHQLAHMGAEVVKVEMPGSGDLARQLGADPELNAARMGVSFLAQNAGKRSIALNLKQAAGKAVLLDLVETADVLLENFRPGVMDRLGLGYETLSARNPGLVYCAISGFGQDGPMSAQPAYDQIVQGIAGVMSVTGERDAGPCRVGFPVADTIGGITAAFAIAAALAGRGLRPDARGCVIDVSMLESVLATMGWVVSNHLVAGHAPARMGNDNFTASPSGAFETGDGLLNIAANKQEQFEILCDRIGRPELKDDPRFHERQARLENRPALSRLVEEALSAKSAAEWESELNAAGVPCGRINTIPAILEHPQIRDRGMVARFDDVPGVGRPVSVLRTGVKLDGEAPRVDTPPPRLGEHTEAILAELGYSAEDVERLRAEGAL